MDGTHMATIKDDRKKKTLDSFQKKLKSRLKKRLHKEVEEAIDDLYLNTDNVIFGVLESEFETWVKIEAERTTFMLDTDNKDLSVWCNIGGPDSYESVSISMEDLFNDELEKCLRDMEAAWSDNGKDIVVNKMCKVAKELRSIADKFDINK